MGLRSLPEHYLIVNKKISQKLGEICLTLHVLPMMYCQWKLAVAETDYMSLLAWGFFWSYTGKSVKIKASRLLFHSFHLSMLEPIPLFFSYLIRDVTYEPCSGKLGISISYNERVFGRLVSQASLKLKSKSLLDWNSLTIHVANSS